MKQIATVVSLLLVGLVLVGCVYNRSGDIRKHYSSFKVAPPDGNTVEVCHGHSCTIRTRYRFRKSDIAEISATMRKVKRADTPFEERRGVAYAIGLIERKVGKKLGIKDRPGMQFRSAGDPTQQDCGDEATNTTSYLLVLQSNGLLKHHTVRIPFSKGNILKGTLQGSPVKYWPHWTAVLEENETGQRYAVDSWPFVNGENPGVVKVEEWYIEDLDRLPPSTN